MNMRQLAKRANDVVTENDRRAHLEPTNRNELDVYVRIHGSGRKRDKWFKVSYMSSAMMTVRRDGQDFPMMEIVCRDVDEIKHEPHRYPSSK